MATISAADRSSSRPSRRLWLPWLLLAISLILITYSVDSFVRLPQQLAVSQQCRMSRMRPAYIDHTADLESFSPSGLWRKYRLYLYRERDFDPMDLPSGSPALFVPGNAGSYGQVRSVSSSAARQFYKQNSGGQLRDEWKDAPAGVAHTDWYTLDFNEDFSAFSGSTLIEQATFINEVIAYLSNRYASPATRNFAAGERNTTVPILAHSMGGIAARLAARMPNYPKGSIDTIVTLSTPHAYPPVPFDRSTEYVYSLINRPSPAAPSGSPASVPPLLVSVAGGILDTQLPSDPSSLALARIGEAVPPSRISTFTTSLPSLWSSVDHLAVMWCDQLREKIARGFLLDMMAFGRIAQDRSAGGTTGRASFLRRRRELWRRALSLFDSSDAGNGDIGPLELIPSKDSIYDEELESFVVEGETPTFNRPASGVDSPLLIGEDSFVYRVPARLGEGDTDVHAFELITNLLDASRKRPSRKARPFPYPDSGSEHRYATAPSGLRIGHSWRNPQSQLNGASKASALLCSPDVSRVVLSQCLIENLARYTLVTNDEPGRSDSWSSAWGSHGSRGLPRRRERHFSEPSAFDHAAGVPKRPCWDTEDRPTAWHVGMSECRSAVDRQHPPRAIQGAA
ncbi:hypothetical protein L1887_47628 [Cichorium endivia]|nr:hypothetical protein L1887_47628 [Cichorium endivia]